MNILHDTVIKIQRLKTKSGNLRAFVATATADCALQPLGKDRGQLDTGLFGSTYVAYVDEDIPVEAGDRVVDGNGVAYSVTQVSVRDNGVNPHKVVVLKKS